MDREADRHARGLATLERIGGPDAAAPILAITDIAPDLARFAIDFAFGEVLCRPGLDPKMRELCTVAALAALGHAPSQLAWHADCALNVGWRPSEVLEAVIAGVVCGSSTEAGTSLRVAREVFARREVGGDALAELDAAVARWCEVPPVIEDLDLDRRSRALIVIAALTAAGRARSRLAGPLREALAAGASRVEVIEATEQMAVYAGFPAALNGIAAAREVLDRG